MSASVATAVEHIDTAHASRVEAQPARIALLGTGNVGRAVLARLAGWTGTPLGQRLQLLHVANSRFELKQARAGWLAAGNAAIAGSSRFRDTRACNDPALSQLIPTPFAAGQGFAIATSSLGHGGVRILVDATASDEVAAQHAQWLARGIHVVTACKLGQGTSLARWRDLRAACAMGGTHYGDSATVGAGLPLLRTIRELRAGGDRIHGIAGVLSGSLAWLFHHYDGRLPFSGFVRQARDAGYTEPDPREDLSGEDVRRKLLILARAAGVELEADAVVVDSLVPTQLAGVPTSAVDACLPLLDAGLRERCAEAWKRGNKLHVVARLQGGKAKVGLEMLPADDPLAAGTGTDNRVAIWSDRYREQPLVVQGPGAGAGVTAAAVLDDVLRIAAASGPGLNTR